MPPKPYESCKHKKARIYAGSRFYWMFSEEKMVEAASTN